MAGLGPAGSNLPPPPPMAMLLGRSGGSELFLQQEGPPEYNKGVLITEKNSGGLKLLHLVIDHRKVVGQLVSSAAPVIRSTESLSAASGGRSWNTHEVKQEQKEEEHVCTICGDTFVQKTAFNSHVKLHLKDKLCRRARQAALAGDSCNKPAVTPLQEKQELKAAVPEIFSHEQHGSVTTPLLLQTSFKQEASTLLDYSPLKVEGEDFVKREFSRQMEINREDLNSDLCSILDQIEKDFEAPSIDLRDVNADSISPLTSDLDKGQKVSLLSNSLERESSFMENISSHGITDSHKQHGLSETLSGKLSIDNIMGGHRPQAIKREFNHSAADHDYLLELPDSKTTDRVLDVPPTAVSQEHSSLLVGGLQPQLLSAPLAPSSTAATAQHPAQSLLKFTSRTVALTSDPPGRIFIRRSSTDPRILNVIRLAQDPAKFGQQDKSRKVQVRRDSRLSADGEMEPGTELIDKDGDSDKQNVQSPMKSKQSADCQVCGKSITTKNMARHMEKHTGKKKFQCDMCQTSFYQKTHLKNHIMLHETGDCHECGECQQRFPRRADFVKHQKAVHQVDPLVVTTPTCSECGTQFTDICKLELHQQVHEAVGKVRQELCGLCGEKFACRLAMMAHMEQHTTRAGGVISLAKSKEKARPFSCTICHKSFSQRSHLNRHIKSHGGSEADLMCQACGRQCRNRVELVRHRAAHIACSICRTLLESRAQLQQHLLTEHPARTAAAGPPANASFMSPGSLSSLDTDLLEDEDEDEAEDDLSSRQFTESPLGMFSSGLDISPRSSASSSASSLAEDWRPKANSTGFLPFFGELESEEWMLESESEGRKESLSLDDIVDTSFFDVNQHLDAEILSTDLFPS